MKQGFILPLVAVVILVALLGAGAAYYVVNQQEQRSPVTLPVVSRAPITSLAPVLDITAKATTSAPSAPGVSFTGTMLAGTTAPLIDFNQADYALAQQSGKVIVLYFYASWCPICRAEFPLMQAAFNQLPTPNVVGFRVNYNDTDTDDTEKGLAREHGVAYQHTKVIIKDGKQILKSPETWQTNRYVTEITNATR